MYVQKEAGDVTGRVSKKDKIHKEKESGQCTSKTRRLMHDGFKAKEKKGMIVHNAYVGYLV